MRWQGRSCQGAACELATIKLLLTDFELPLTVLNPEGLEGSELLGTVNVLDTVSGFKRELDNRQQPGATMGCQPLGR